jgi:hypothetical protein
MAGQGPLVAARFLDGRVVKGRAVEFEPQRALHVQEEQFPAPVRIPVGALKAVFFIKKLAGDPEHRDRKRYEDSALLGKRVWVEFLDGEEMAGWSHSVSAEGDGFYLFPTDPGSNIEMAYVFRHALRRVLRDGEALAAAREHAAKTERASVKSPEEWSGFVRTARA